MLDAEFHKNKNYSALGFLINILLILQPYQIRELWFYIEQNYLMLLYVKKYI